MNATMLDVKEIEEELDSLNLRIEVENRPLHEEERCRAKDLRASYNELRGLERPYYLRDAEALGVKDARHFGSPMAMAARIGATVEFVAGDAMRKEHRRPRALGCTVGVHSTRPRVLVTLDDPAGRPRHQREITHSLLHECAHIVSARTDLNYCEAECDAYADGFLMAWGRLP